MKSTGAPAVETGMERAAKSAGMVEWLGLPWDPACVEFYKTSRLVKTASVAQVRQPIYSRSIGRWKQYQDVLEPFFRMMDT